MVNPVPDSDVGASKDTRISLENETLASCRLVIERMYDRSDRGEFVCSFIDAYDIFAAGVAFACITYRHQTGDNDDQDVLMRVTDVMNKCSTLITIISGRFPALKAFNRVILALLSRLIELHTPNSRVRLGYNSCESGGPNTL